MSRDTAPDSRPPVIRASSEGLASETWHRPFVAAAGRGVVRLALDLSEVDRLDTLQLARLTQLTTVARRTGGDVHLFAVRPHARRLLTEVVPEGTFSIYDDAEEALTARWP